jgi:hypothetical protein
MSRLVTTSIVLAVLCAVGPPGRAAAQQPQPCMLNGQLYPENAVVCSNGLAQYCANGTWQNNEGARCDTQSGSYLGPRRPLEEKSAEPIPDFYKEKYPGLNLQ